MTTSCYSESKATMNSLIHLPTPFKFLFRKRGPWNPWRGSFWMCMAKQTCAFPGLDCGGCENPLFRSPPEGSMVDCWLELSPISKRGGAP